MNKQELIGKYKYLNHNFFRRVDTSEVLRDLKQLDEPQKVKIPQFVADWIEYCKFTHVDLQHAFIVGDVYFYNYANQKDFSKLKEFLETESNQETFVLAWIYGYEGEKEKRYRVKIKGKIKENLLVYGLGIGRYFFARTYDSTKRNEHTRKQKKKQASDGYFLVKELRLRRWSDGKIKRNWFSNHRNTSKGINSI